MNVKEFGEKIRDLRKVKGITLKELGEEINFTKSYLSMIETGTVAKTPNPDTIKKLARGLDADYLDLLLKAGHIEEAEKEGLMQSADAYKRYRDREMLEDFADRETLQKLYDEQQKALNHMQDMKKFLQQDYKTQTSTVGAYDYSPHYNGHKLTDDERQQLLIMLQAYLNKYEQ